MGLIVLVLDNYLSLYFGRVSNINSSLFEIFISTLTPEF